MSEDQLIGIIYSQLLEEFGFGYSEKDLWMIAENIAEKNCKSDSTTQRQPENRVGVVETNCASRKANASCILDDE